jgi:DNA processing protein
MLRLARVFGSPEAALQASAQELAARGGISPDQASVLTSLGDAEAVLRPKIEAWRSRGIELLTISDDGYPGQLAGLRTPPPLLYLRGSLRPEDARAIAIVGTRQPDRRGSALARRLGYEFAGRGFTIVSGLARGIDTAGHRGALRAEQGRTIAVLGSGLFRVYPPENALLAQRIAARGCLISEAPPETEVQTALLLMRDRIQAALSRAVVVVQAHGQCGSIVTARHAVQCGRLLYGIAWDSPPFSEGWRVLKSLGARPITPDADFDRLASEIDAPPGGPRQEPLL